MTVEEYRNRLMDAFHNADCGELIAVVVRPEESEFKQLEWLLKNHYHNQKQQPSEDCISRQAVNDLVDELARAISDERCYMSRGRSTATIMQDILDLPPVTPKEKTAHWVNKTLIYKSETEGERDCYAGTCSACGGVQECWNYCGGCGARMVEQQEKSEYEHDHELVKAYNDGQAYILDKIRAEIEKMKLDVDLDIGNEMIYNNAIKDVLEIIDKYRGDTDGSSSNDT